MDYPNQTGPKMMRSIKKINDVHNLTNDDLTCENKLSMSNTTSLSYDINQKNNTTAAFYDDLSVESEYNIF